MNYISYQHIERINTPGTAGIEYGMCYIFPKLDGTNSVMWLNDDGTLGGGSRKRILSLDKDNANFYNDYVLGNKERNLKFFEKHPELMLYGEFLVPHTLKTYQDDSWRKFYIFDVCHVVKGDDGEDYIKRYLPYEEYKEMLDEFGFDYIPPICKIENPNVESLFDLLDKNSYLIKDNAGFGEGIVIKNYEFKNKFGRITWGKIVRNDFKDKNSKVFGVTEIKDKESKEQEIINLVLTKELLDKEISKILLELNTDYFEPKLLPRLFGTMFYVIITEELYDALKKLKNPIVDFKKLNSLLIVTIKKMLNI